MKLKKRAHVNHLVDYDSINIFRIWIPSRQKIIRTKNVIFNENKFYDFSEFDLFQLITEPMIETIFEILFSQHFFNIVSFIEINVDDVDIIDVNAFENVNLQPVESIDKTIETIIESQFFTFEIISTFEFETAAGFFDSNFFKFH